MASVPLIDGYSIGSRLYSNRYTLMDVHEARNLVTSEAVIIKSYTCENLQTANGPLGEGVTLSRLEHPHICRLIDVRLSDSTGQCQVHLILEKLERDLLQDVQLRTKQARPYSELELVGFLMQVGSAIAFAKKKGIAHRDIKPENILLDSDGGFKLCDFGSSWQRSLQTMTNSPAGTLLYMSPQVRLSFVSSANKYSPYKADVYSLGVTALHLATLVPPMRLGSEGMESLVEEQLSQFVCSDALKKWLRAMVHLQEDQRADIEEVVEGIANLEEHCPSTDETREPVELVSPSPVEERKTSTAPSMLATCGTGILTKLFLFDCIGKSWQRLNLKEAVNVNRQTSYLLLRDGSVFCCGGRSYTGNYLASACLIKRDGAILQLNVMREIRSTPGIVNYGDFIYAFGGSECSSYVALKSKKSAEKYSLSHGKWFTLRDMRCARECFNPCVGRGRIFLCGGFDTSVEIFDPASEQCFPFPGLTLPESTNCTAVYSENRLVVFTTQHCCCWNFDRRALEVKKRKKGGIWSSSLPVVVGELIFIIPQLWIPGACSVFDINTGSLQETISF